MGLIFFTSSLAGYQMISEAARHHARSLVSMSLLSPSWIRDMCVCMYRLLIIMFILLHILKYEK